MKLLAAVLAIVLVSRVRCQHTLTPTGTSVAGNTVTVNLKVDLGADTSITGLAIWSQADNNYPCSTHTTTDDITVSAADSTSFTVTVSLSESAFSNSAGTPSGCPYTFDSNQNPTAYTFYVRTFVAFPPTTGTIDREFPVSIDAQSIPFPLIPGTTTFSPAAGEPQVISVPATAITKQLTVVAAATQVMQTSLDIGTPTQLKLEMTINPYNTLVSIAGARVHTCVADNEPSFIDTAGTSPTIEFIGSNSCFKETSLFPNPVTKGGFSRHSSSNTVGPLKTFIAYSNKFEMSGFYQEDITATSSLYFRCHLTFCYDDTITTAGTCGGEHCANAKKKRSINDAHLTVTANITVNPRQKNAEKTCKRCTDTGLYQGTIGALATLSAILFGAMFFTYSSVKTAILKRQGAQHDQQVTRCVVPGLNSSSKELSTNETSSDTFVPKPVA